MTSVNGVSQSQLSSINNLNTKIYGGFKFSEDGKSAVKFFKLTNQNGVEKNYSFRIYFSSKTSKKDNIELLKKYNPEKVETLGKMSIELGLGETYKGLSFSGSGEKSRLDLTKRDGTVEKVNSDFSSDIAIEKAQAKLRMYKTLAFVTNMSAKKNNHEILNKKSSGISKGRSKALKTKERQLNEVEQLKQKNEAKANQIRIQLIEYAIDTLAITKDWYIDDIKVSIYYEDLFENLENKSINDISDFLRANEENKFKK